MTTCAEYQTRFADADLALHRLMTGSKSESFAHGENRLTYTRASLPELQRYVQYLQAKIDACNGVRVNKHRIFGIIPSDGC